jgi:hypothetical protein
MHVNKSCFKEQNVFITLKGDKNAVLDEVNKAGMLRLHGGSGAEWVCRA